MGIVSRFAVILVFPEFVSVFGNGAVNIQERRGLINNKPCPQNVPLGIPLKTEKNFYSRKSIFLDKYA
jgi:hypothetical protein